VDPAPPPPHRPLPLILQELRDLEALEGDLDRDAVTYVNDELLAAFAAAPEGAALADLRLSQIVLDFAAREHGATILSLQPDALRGVVFDVIPRKVMVPADAADGLLAAVRALYAYLGREVALPQADACLAALPEAALPELTAALGDPRKFSPGKLMYMAGLEAGYDLGTPEGMDAWMREAKRRGLTPAGPAPASRTPRAPDPRKAARKAARKARKQGR
jgi:hypothetical protein